MVPAVLIELKMGDSFIFKRIYREMVTKMMEIRKGMRHPHAEKASLLIEYCVARMTMRETNRPSVAVI